MAIKVTGLVRISSHVQQQLRRDLTAEEIAALRRQVQETVDQVDTICRSHKMKPEQLPAPSRRAYTYLTSLDWQHVRAVAAGTMTMPSPAPEVASGSSPHAGEVTPPLSPRVRGEREALSGADGPTPSPHAGRAGVGAAPSPRAGRAGVEEAPSLRAGRAEVGETPSRHVEQTDGEPAAAAPAPEDGGTDTTGTPIRISRLISAGTAVSAQLWREAERQTPAERISELALPVIARHVQQIERLCADNATSPAALPAPSRSMFAWLAWMNAPENLRRQIDALAVAHAALVALPAARSPFAIELHLQNVQPLWRMRSTRGHTLITVSVGFVDAGLDVWTPLVAWALSRRARAGAAEVEAYAASEEFAAVLFDIAAQAMPPQRTRGRAHDLGAAFARVNEQFFGGTLDRPVLHWSEVLTARTFGHYQPARDHLMLSSTLDDPQVPEYVVDYVMYHELLHKRLGMVLKNGRRISHDATFRAAERLFPQHRQAEKVIGELARRLR